MITTLTFRDILNPNYKHWKDFDSFSDFAKDLGYSHVAWNGRVYEAGNFEVSSTFKDLGLDSRSVDAQQLRSDLKQWRDMEVFYDLFLKSGYPEYLWNGLTYNVSGVVGTTPGMGY